MIIVQGLIFGLITIMMISGVTLILPNAFASDFSFTSECVGGVWEGKITSIEGEPLANTTVRTIMQLTSSSFEKKFITDQDGIVKIPFEYNTGNIWLQKGGYNDQKQVIEKCKLESKSTNDAQEVSIKASWGVACEYGRQLLPMSNSHDGFYYALLQKC